MKTRQGPAAPQPRHVGDSGGRRTPVSARARRRGRGRAAVCGRLRRAAAPREAAGVAPGAGGHRGARHLFTTSATRTTSRCGTCSRRSCRLAAHARRRARRDRRGYTKLFWINSGSVQQPDGAEVRAGVQPGRVRARPCGGCRAARGVPPARRRAARCARSSRLRPLFFDRSVRSDRHEQDARRGTGHPHGEREQPVRRRHGWPTSTGSRRRTR